MIAGRLAAPAALAVLGLMLLPARVTPLRGDDVFSFQLQGRLGLTGDSLAGHIWDGAWTSLTEGRPQPLGSLWGNLVIAALGSERVAYKVFLVLVTVACAALLYALVRRLGGSAGVAAMAVLLTGGAIQFRAYHDPMLGYYVTTQATLACVLVSLLLMLRGRPVWAVLLFACSVLLYEVMAPVAVVHLGLATAERRWRAGLPFLTVAALFVAYGFLVRTFGGGDSGGGYAVGYSPGAILGTYLEQLIPPLPGANVLFGDGTLFARPTLPELVGAAWRGALVFAAVVVVGWRRPALRMLPAAVTGALLIASPVLLIALAEKYQRELSPATGYLPVIAQTFGWALLASAAVVAVARRSRPATLALALLLGAGAALSGYDVVRVAASEVPRATVTDAVVRAAQRGLLQAVPEGAAVVFVENDLGSGATGWGERHAMDAMLLEATGRRYDVRHHPGAGMGTCQPDPEAEHPVDCGPLPSRGAWLRVGARRGQTVVTVATYSGPAFGSPAQELWVYAEGDAWGPPLLTGTAAGASWSGDGKLWHPVFRGAGWTTFNLEPDEPAPAADSLAYPGRTIDVAAPVPAPERVRQLGTARVLP